jgi:hypothetical protein
MLCEMRRDCTAFVNSEAYWDMRIDDTMWGAPEHRTFKLSRGQTVLVLNQPVSGSVVVSCDVGVLIVDPDALTPLKRSCVDHTED